MKLGDLAGPESVLSADGESVEIAGLTADSRDVAPGFLFAALPGTLTDGAKFIPQALEQGAAAVLLPAGSPAADGLGVPCLFADDARRALALMAARFYPAQPRTVVAVTGTNGKTSVVAFVRQIWQGLGYAAGSIGTVGIDVPDGAKKLAHTTPDPVALHAMMAGLSEQGITHLAFEASSHGLQQRRLDGMRIAAAAFTNISRDHLDYHSSFDDYLEQKLRLFRDLLPDGAPIVVDPDESGSNAVCDVAAARALPIVSVGKHGETLKLARAEREGFSQRLSLVSEGKTHEVLLPLPGDFQISNALVAAGLCIACGAGAGETIAQLAGLKGARGRLEQVALSRAGAPIFVDYAHTPDALANALAALRPYASGRLLVVFGCGGDRDRGKRPQMGQIASTNADVVVVTDDNPRSEDPSFIRSEILAAAPGAIETGDRFEAISAAIAQLRNGDILLVAGKGHETGQIVGGKIIPFSDHEAIEEIARGGDSDG